MPSRPPRRARRKRTPAKRDTTRIAYTPRLVAALRHGFEETPQSLDTIASANGMSRRTLSDKAKAEGWVRFTRPALDLSPAVKLDARLADIEAQGEGAQITNRAMKLTPTPDPSPQEPAPGPAQARPGWGGEKDIDSLIQSGLQGVLEEALELMAAVKAAREEMQETGRLAQAAALGRDLNALTNVFYRAKRMAGGAPDGALPDDDVPTDLDTQRDDLARTIGALVDEWLHARHSRQAERAADRPPEI